MKKILILLAFGILLFGCTQGTTKTPAVPGNVTLVKSGTVTVHIKDFAFTPSELSIQKGSTIVWVNDDEVPHSIKGEGFESSVFAKGDRFEYTFTDAGAYPYICGIHTSMKGLVSVK